LEKEGVFSIAKSMRYQYGPEQIARLL
jgi:hypothetical protein